MKSILLLLVLVFNLNMQAQSLQGSWKLAAENGKEVTGKEVIRIYADSYFTEGAKDPDSNEFLWARGGEYHKKDDQVRIDFDTRQEKPTAELVAHKIEFEEENSFSIEQRDTIQKWTRVSGNKNELSGNWVITGRERNGEMNQMKPGDRKTIKMLGGDRFQWVAFNSATGEFFGTGGGTYIAKDGKYVENIEFFSRDASRVGASLEFNYKVEDGSWVHSGKSSKGDPIKEIWSPCAEAYSRN